jgi:hypothetical protein
MPSREPYVLELAHTVNEIFGKGKNDPSFREIAAAHFPGKALGEEVVDGIRKRLHKIRDVLEHDYEQPVCLLSHVYYSRFKTTPPSNMAEARRCIPGGNGLGVAGIRLHTGDDDMIWQSMVAMNFSAGAGKVKKQADRVLDAVQDHRLETPRAKSLLVNAQQEMEPENPALQRKVLTAVTGKK